MTNPPNIEVERSVLGAALLDADKVVPFALNRKNLTPSAFYHLPHSYLWGAIMEMSAKKQGIDVLTITEHLIRNGGLEKAGGKEYINNLLTAVPTACHAEYYINLVCQQNTIRQIATLSAALAEATKSGELNECKKINTQIREKLDSHFQTTAEAERFPPIRYQDLVDYKTPEGHIIAGAGWLRRGAGCLLTGGTSLGKSILASQIAVCVGAGTSILGCIKITAPRRVTYLQAENDEETLQRDILSIVNFTHADTALIQENLAIHHLYGLSGPSLDSWIENQIVQQKTDLLILDPYQSFIPGSMNINDAGTFLAFIFNLNRIIKEHNCAFLLVTHTPKPQDREHWTARESVYMAVGSQAIAAWARTSAEITGFKDDDTKYRLRFGKNAERTGLITESGALIRDLMIQHSSSIHEPYWEVSQDQSAPSSITKKGEEIIRLATEHPSMSQREIARLVKCSVGTVSAWYPHEKN